MAGVGSIYNQIIRVSVEICDIIFGACGTIRHKREIPKAYRKKIPHNLVQDKYIRTCHATTLIEELEKKITQLENQLQVHRATQQILISVSDNIPQEGEPIFLRGKCNKHGIVPIVCMNSMDLIPEQGIQIQSSSEDESTDPSFQSLSEDTDSSEISLPDLETISSPWIDDPLETQV